jgi:parvulin-like peptidyl-prolyl isomerase
MSRRAIVLSAGLLALAACRSPERPTRAAAPAASPPAAAPARAPASPGAANDPDIKLPDQVAVSDILFSYKGARGARAETSRGREQARAAAEQALRRIRAGARFEDVARASSDSPFRERGGYIGVLETRRLYPSLRRAFAVLAEGSVSDVVESPIGFHILRREKLESVTISHVLYLYRGSHRAPERVTRSRDEARSAAAAALARLKGGARLEDIARTQSDCPSRERGGDLGPIHRGATAPAFERAAFALEVGEISGVVETPFGYHVLQRTR